MKNQKTFTRVLILFLFLHGWSVSRAQFPVTAKYRWSKNSPSTLPAGTTQAYQNLPEADYTPPNNIGQWSAAEKIRSFAASYAGNLQVNCILTVDEKGRVRNIKVVDTNDPKSTAALTSMLINSKMAGPSYDHNKAVSCYVPCSIEITGHQVNIL